MILDKIKFRISEIADYIGIFIMPKTEALCFIQLGKSRLETEEKQFLFLTCVKLYTGVVQYSNKRVGKIKFSIIIMPFNEHPQVFTIPD